jgi:hypothetical protein
MSFILDTQQAKKKDHNGRNFHATPMKKILHLIIVQPNSKAKEIFDMGILPLVVLLGWIGCFAQTTKPECPKKSFSSQVQVGGDYSHVWIKPQGEKTSQGNLGGAQASYEYCPPSRFYGGGQLSWKQGDTHCSNEKRSLLYIDAHERLGYTFAWAQDTLSLFSGFGYRYLRQHVRPSESSVETFNAVFFPPFLTSATDVVLAYQEIYIPVGFVSNCTLNSWCSIGVNVTWMPQVFAVANIKPLGGSFWSLVNRYGNVMAELPLTFIVTQDRSCSLMVKPYYEYWQDGQSTAKTSTGVPLDLPGNTYQFAGCDLNFSYRF